MKLLALLPRLNWLRRRTAPLNQHIEQAEEQMLKLPQVDCRLEHRFAPGVYARTIYMPAGSDIIGHEHKTAHFNIIISGRALVMMEGQTEEIAGPCIFVSQPGVRKVLRILEDMVWMTIHPTKETDLKKLEKQLIVKSKAFLYHAKTPHTLTSAGGLS